MSNRGFFSREAIRFGWNAMKGNSLFFLLLFILPVLINVLVGREIWQPLYYVLQSSDPKDATAMVWIALGFFFLNFPLLLGLVRVSLQLTDGAKPTFMSFLSSYRRVIEYLVGWLILGFVTVVALILWGALLLFPLSRVVPTSAKWIGGLELLVIFAPLYLVPMLHAFFVHLIVEGRYSGLTALKRASEITKGQRWPLFVFYLLLISPWWN